MDIHDTVNEVGNYRVFVMDQYGLSKYESSFSSKQFLLDLSSLQNGIYGIHAIKEEKI